MKEKITKILAEIRPELDFTEYINFIEEGMLDSFDVVNLITSLEDEFNINIDGMDVDPDNFENLDKIIQLVTKYK